MRNIVRLSILFFLLCNCVDSYKILVVSNVVGHSHLKFMGKIADVLTEAGHDVTVLFPISFSEYINKLGVKATKKRIILPINETTEAFAKQQMEQGADIWTMKPDPSLFINKAKGIGQLVAMMCEDLFLKADIIEQLKKENFDVGIVEPFEQCGPALMDEIKIRSLILAISSLNFDAASSALGIPQALSWVPALSSEASDQMTIFEKLMNVLHRYGGIYMFSLWGDMEYEAIRRHRPNLRDWRQILPEASIVFTNSNPFLDFAHPSLQKVIDVGGLTVEINEKELKLEKEWEEILSRRKSAILVSFGSMMQSKYMPIEMKNTMLSVFESFPDITFIWKYEEKDAKLAAHLKNVVLSTWVPQNALLSDPRLKLFITHGGLGSITEVAYMGKPIIAIPMFADQTRNARMLQRQNAAIVLRKDSLYDADAIRNAIQEIVSNPSYTENARRISEIIRNPPIQPRDLIIKYTEFVAKFGKLPQLDPYGRHLNFFQYYLLDVLLLVLGVIFVILFAGYLLIRKCLRVLCGSSKIKKD